MGNVHVQIWRWSTHLSRTTHLRPFLVLLWESVCMSTHVYVCGWAMCVCVCMCVWAMCVCACVRPCPCACVCAIQTGPVLISLRASYKHPGQMVIRASKRERRTVGVRSIDLLENVPPKTQSEVCVCVCVCVPSCQPSC